MQNSPPTEGTKTGSVFSSSVTLRARTGGGGVCAPQQRFSYFSLCGSLLTACEHSVRGPEILVQSVWAGLRVCTATKFGRRSCCWSQGGTWRRLALGLGGRDPGTAAQEIGTGPRSQGKRGAGVRRRGGRLGGGRGSDSGPGGQEGRRLEPRAPGRTAALRLVRFCGAAWGWKEAVLGASTRGFSRRRPLGRCRDGLADLEQRRGSRPATQGAGAASLPSRAPRRPRAEAEAEGRRARTKARVGNGS